MYFRIKEKYDYASMLAQIFIFWAIGGAFLGIPYCLLAGWSSDNISTIIFVAPLFVAVWLFFAALAGAINESSYRKKIKFEINWHALLSAKDDGIISTGTRKFGIIFFWIWTVVMLLPVISHWLAHGLLLLGFQQIGTYLEIHRYQSQTGFFIVALVAAVVIVVAKEIISSFKR